jgi:hypothetical protein
VLNQSYVVGIKAIKVVDASIYLSLDRRDLSHHSVAFEGSVLLCLLGMEFRQQLNGVDYFVSHRGVFGRGEVRTNRHVAKKLAIR